MTLSILSRDGEIFLAFSLGICYTIARKAKGSTAMTPIPVLTAARMKACDSYTIDTLGIPSQALMERAAREAVAFLLERVDLYPDGKVLLLCGSGNNGGDGFAMGRFLTDGSMGGKREAVILYTGRLNPDGTPDETRMSEECGRQYRLAREAGIPIRSAADVTSELAEAAVIVDAIFGIGLDRPITGELASLLSAVAESHLPVLAVDIPSGIHADTGAVMGVALPARATVTMQALKAGLLRYPGADFCGEISVAELGIDLTPAETPYASLSDEALLRWVLPPRGRRSHKGTYGTVTLLCGSEGMSGAAVLATKAALRSGVGLARVLTPACNRVVLQTSVPEAIVSVYDKPQELTEYARADALVLGCGLGTSELSREALREVLDACPRDGSVPAVLDADGLNLLAKEPALWETSLLTAPDRQAVITPHPAEMSRLSGLSVAEILSNPVSVAVDFARKRGVTVVLKDAHTVIASPEGQIFICAAGNAGMAKGGSGDALAGIIGALLAQSRHRLGCDLTAAEVAAAGVYLHARAGDLTAEALGEYGMLASDLIERIPLVCKGFSDSRTRLYF